jgi:hypothetical protein
VDEGRVRVTSPDVQGIYVWAWPTDVSRVWRLAHRYQLSDEELEMVVASAPAAESAAPSAGELVQDQGVRRQPAGRRHWVCELWTDETFELFVDGHVAERKPNPYGFIPYVVYPNVRVPKQFWGLSDILAVRESARELNRAMSQLSRILELSGSPIAVLENVSASNDIQVAPGAVWEIPEAAKAYLLDLLQGGGVAFHKDFLELLYRTVHDLGESPRVSFGEADAALSGVAMELQLDPLVKKVERKRRVREAALRRRDWMVLKLLTQFGGADYAPFETRIVWGPLLPPDRARLVMDEVSLVGAGVHSRQTAARALGSEDPLGEFEAWRAEQRRIQAEGLLAEEREREPVEDGGGE